MTNTKHDCEVVTETTVDGRVVQNDTIVPRYPVWAETLTEAREAVLMDHGDTIKKAKAPGVEVCIICKPFCSE